MFNDIKLAHRSGVPRCQQQEGTPDEPTDIGTFREKLRHLYSTNAILSLL
jgi:hypothetical protein